MSYLQRHLEMQGDGPDEMPQWALACGTSASQYNLLAAQLQSNVARHAEGGGFVLNPQLRLVNHACGDAANARAAVERAVAWVAARLNAKGDLAEQLLGDALVVVN